MDKKIASNANIPAEKKRRIKLMRSAISKKPRLDEIQQQMLINYIQNFVH